MKITRLLPIACLCFSAFTAAATSKLSPADREHLLQARDVTLLRSMRQIPEEVVRACATVTGSRDFELADPGQPFQVTDVITDKSLPWRRLIWAARISGYYVVHYERGGIAHSYHILVVALSSPERARVAWAAAAIPLKNYDEFRVALKTSKLDDSLDFAH